MNHTLILSGIAAMMCSARVRTRDDSEPLQSIIISQLPIESL